ncbi:MAG: PucR family transcriptional regulator [Solirubrobacteraceae bacterium]
MAAITQAQMEDRVIETVEGQLETIVDRLVAEVDARRLLAGESGSRLVAHLRQAAAAELHAGIRAFSLDRRLPDAPPAESGNLAREAARARVPLAVLMRTYMVALNVYWEAIYDAILACAAPRPVQNELVRVGTRFLQEFIGQISALAAVEYTDERDRAVRRRTLRRLATVRDILAGTGSSRAVLDYDLQLTHRAVVATGAGAEDVLATLRADSQLAVLAVPDGDTVWAWLGGSREALGVAKGALAAAADETVRLGIGREQAGVEGFRVTHRQAVTAHALAVSLERPLVRHDEIALEALAGVDGAAAKQFIQDELRALSAPRERHERLLRTLRAYLDSGQNGAAAAARLGVSARTVSHRLRLIEASLGHPVADRAVELHTALRLRKLANEPHPHVR